jgi:hypothetical protein
MELHPNNKYHLNDLHREIDLFDRKIAYCQGHAKFESEPERAIALRKLETKRKSLVNVAVDLVSKGVEYDAKHLPRSFKGADATSAKESA